MKKSINILAILMVVTFGIVLPDRCEGQSTSSMLKVFPLISAHLSSKFGIRKHPVYKSVRHHNGIDLSAPEGSHVRSVASGIVVYADSYAGYGKLVTVEHGNGYQSMYGHLSEILVNTGDEVNAGTVIARVGETGIATGPHLHFEWRSKGVPVDPLNVFPQILAQPEG